MADDLHVGIGADTGGLEKGLDKSKKSIKDFGEAIKDSAKDTDKLSSSARSGVDAAKQLGNAFSSAQASATDTAGAIIDAGEAIGAASKEMKNAKGATMALSAATTTGLITALGTVLIILGKYSFSLSDAAKQAKALRDATKKAIGSAQVQITTYNQLLGIARDVTRSDEERQEALDRVNKASGKYVGNLKLEGINTDDAIKKTNKYTAALIRQAKIKGLEGRLADLYAKQYEISSRTIEEGTDSYEKWGAAIISGTVGAGVFNSTLFTANTALGRQAKELKNVDSEIKNLTGSLLKLNDLENKIASGSGGGGGASSGKRSPLTSVFAFDPAKVTSEGLKGFRQAEKALRNRIGPVLNGFNSQIIIGPNDEARIKSAEAWQKQNEADAAAFRQKEAQLDQFNQNISSIISQGTASAFAGIGEAIGGAITSGGDVLGALGASLLGSLGGILVELGKMAIAVGVGLQAIKASLESLNPVAAIAAGIALVALGSIFKSGAASLSERFEGGGGSGGVSGSGTSTGGPTTRSVTATGGGFSGGTVVFEIAGTKLVGVLNKTLQRNTALGGTLTIGG